MSYQFAENQASINQPSSFRLAPNVAALISYIWIPVTSILVLVTEKENRTVRFHAFQSLFLGLAVFVSSIVLSVVMGILGGIAAMFSATLGMLVMFGSLILWLVFTVAIVAAWVMCLVKAYRSEMYQLPFVGKFAERMASK
jgi:uncharacterized membrane protein